MTHNPINTKHINDIELKTEKPKVDAVELSDDHCKQISGGANIDLGNLTSRPLVELTAIFPWHDPRINSYAAAHCAFETGNVEFCTGNPHSD